MKKRVFGRKFSRGRGAREALFRSLIRAFVANGKITTTKAKAKTIQRIIEDIMTHAKEGSLGARRKVLRELGNDRETVDAVFIKVAPVFKKRLGGYTKITYLPRRIGDAAEMARIEWTEKIKEGSTSSKSSTGIKGRRNVQK